MTIEDETVTSSLSTSSSPLWTNTLLSVLKKRRLRCHLLSPQSPRFKTLLQRLENNEYFSEVSTAQDVGLSRDVEKTLFEAFSDDDFDGALHLLVVEEELGDGQEYDTVGIVFWRDVAHDEMSEWLNLSNTKNIHEVMNMLELEEMNHEHHQPLTLLEKEMSALPSMPTVSRQRQLSIARQHSALSFQSNHELAELQSTSHLVPRSIVENLSHAWIKIELLAVKKSFWGRRIGSLLLTCCLYYAYMGNTTIVNNRFILDDEHQEEESTLNFLSKREHISKQRCVLHVAGGKNNIPALKLYHRFGFIPASHLFTKPNKDLYVLGDIGHSLERLFDIH